MIRKSINWPASSNDSEIYVSLEDADGNVTVRSVISESLASRLASTSATIVNPAFTILQDEIYVAAGA